jgi:hypothetical protein
VILYRKMQPNDCKSARLQLVGNQCNIPIDNSKAVNSYRQLAFHRIGNRAASFDFHALRYYVLAATQEKVSSALISVPVCFALHWSSNS